MSQPSNHDAPMDAAMAALEPGFLVGNGRFTLVRFIGRGGMGVVWLARDESLREDVVLKFPPPEIRFDAVALDDLRRETARPRKLTHPSTICIHDLYKDTARCSPALWRNSETSACANYFRTELSHDPESSCVSPSR